jgi:hypothetical protein
LTLGAPLTLLEVCKLPLDVLPFAAQLVEETRGGLHIDLALLHLHGLEFALERFAAAGRRCEGFLLWAGSRGLRTGDVDMRTRLHLDLRFPYLDRRGRPWPLGPLHGEREGGHRDRRWCGHPLDLGPLHRCAERSTRDAFGRLGDTFQAAL